MKAFEKRNQSLLSGQLLCQANTLALMIPGTACFNQVIFTADLLNLKIDLAENQTAQCVGLLNK